MFKCYVYDKVIRQYNTHTLWTGFNVTGTNIDKPYFQPLLLGTQKCFSLIIKQNLTKRWQTMKDLSVFDRFRQYWFALLSLFVVISKLTLPLPTVVSNHSIFSTSVFRVKVWLFSQKIDVKNLRGSKIYELI